MNPRLNQLLEFYKEDPHDPFNVYALAMEYLGNEPNQALIYLELLIKDHPDYLPTYYQLAGLYVDLGFEDKAKITYEIGIEKAIIANKTHTLSELKRAYQNFLFEM